MTPTSLLNCEQILSCEGVSSLQKAILFRAKSVLSLEALALQTMAEGLGDEFVKAITLLCSLKGRLIVTGMGKSGHIGRKIAATLASTGTPSFFIHPAEASHGDLGMIGENDAILCLSNSGETTELNDIVLYSRRHSLPLLCMVSKKESFLGRHADITLVLPAIPEACPHELAPTTSTTAMLALGDALAIALLEQKNFTADNFRRFHPGGKLGARLLKVCDLMHTGADIPLVYESDLMPDVMIHITSKSFGCTGVIDQNGILKGVITDGDLRRHMSVDFLTKTAAQVMTKNPITLFQDELAAKALALMEKKRITSLFVTVPLNHDVQGGKPMGLLHIHDCLRAGLS
jgi:arabinose-5-phosphate isomerase